MLKNLSQIMIINNTGVILSKLHSLKKCNFYDLQAFTGLEEIDFYLALGYLFKEGKITFSEKDNDVCILPINNSQV